MKQKKGFREFRQSGYHWPVLAVIVIVFILGMVIGGGGDGSPPPEAGEAGQTAEAQTWTCSMHPQIQQPKFGKCPLCFMDLVPVESGGGDDLGPRQLKLTPHAVKLAEIRTAPVERRFAETEIRMVGKVEVDETREAHITARVPGRIDRLYVDYTGVRVRKGDHLVYLYSPDLITAQQELLQALKFHRDHGSGAETLEAVRDKLELWGLSRGQIRAIEKRGKPTDHLTIYSPLSGIVVRKDVVEGVYVNTGSRIYTIADLSHLWVKMDAYESDLSWLRYGQAVEFESEAYPGDVFTGRIAFIDPVLNPATRTVKVRVNIDNESGKLKPQMFVRAVVRSRLSQGGHVIDPGLAGKWISPMHPEIIRDRPGKCDVCGMSLVKAETLGYTANEVEQEPPLIIPTPAALVTGKRAVVYVAVAGQEGIFEGRDIVLGPRAGSYYLVREGLEEGEQVVVNGAFKIDSDLQIQARRSMMSPPEDDATTEIAQSTAPDYRKEMIALLDSAQSPKNLPDTFKKSVDALAGGYFAIQQGLSNDSLDQGQDGGKALLKQLAAVDMKQLSGPPQTQWTSLQSKLKKAGQHLVEAQDIAIARDRLEEITLLVTTALREFGTTGAEVYVFHCPMAFNNKGAYWLQGNMETRNPYFGSSMLMCKDKAGPLFATAKDTEK